MQERQASWTAIYTAIFRAAHQLLDATPKILDDPVAVGLVEGSSEAEIRAQAADFQHPLQRLARSLFVVRSRFAEDQLAEAVKAGVGQYVVLGAGLDTFAYRQPAWAHTLRVIEVDHPTSQALKHHYLQQARVAIPANVAFCPIDFERTTLRQGLETVAFDPQVHAAGVERLLRDERFLIGLSDGGAHVDVLCDAGYATALLDIWVRQREVLSLEQAVHKLTAVPAALFGMPNRGTLAAGQVADLVLFDPHTVAARPPESVRDFPRQGRRLISRAEGIVATFVAGTQVYAQGTHTGEFPGRVLRSDE